LKYMSLKKAIKITLRSKYIHKHINVARTYTYINSTHFKFTINM